MLASFWPNLAALTQLMKSTSPIVKHLVLIGGGHSHLAVIKHLGMKPVPGLAVTLISKDVVTPYSGSMPAFIAGHYNFDDMHIDLRPLAQFAKIRIIQASVHKIDLDRKIISIDARPDLSFDLISLNIGSKPNDLLIAGSSRHAFAVKPIDTFLQHWQTIFQNAVQTLKENKPYTLAIVGGGPASVELAFAAHYRIHKAMKTGLTEDSLLAVKIVTNAESALNSHNQKAKAAVAIEFEKRKIEVLSNQQVIEFTEGTIVCESGETISADSIVYATGASIPGWPGECGLKLSNDGFIEVNQNLQSTSHDFVFAAGDVATILNHPRPKSGVYAVRQGKPLAENLVRYATNRSLLKHIPQRDALALINLGDKTAIASRGNWFFQGKKIWRLKDWIDSGFVKKYTELPVMKDDFTLATGLVDKKSEAQLRAHAMRCAGCGAKVAGDVLEEVLDSLPRVSKKDIVVSSSHVEDASQIDLGGNRKLLQSIDQINAFIDDPWIFAKIATNHCLSDIYAMGIQPHSALALVSLPHADAPYLKAQLNELMTACAETLSENDCALIGGHSAESSDLLFGLCVNGFSEGTVLEKGELNEGDMLILTKPLGTGTLLAADMRHQAKHPWIQSALEAMLISNRSASEIFVKHSASACTDITGFGLAGHLLEMLQARAAHVALDLDALPILPGALECLEQGITSSLHKGNTNTATFVTGDLKSTLSQIIFDPQTSGGLLAALSPDKAQACLTELKDAGLKDASIVGKVSGINHSLAQINLK